MHTGIALCIYIIFSLCTGEVSETREMPLGAPALLSTGSLANGSLSVTVDLYLFNASTNRTTRKEPFIPVQDTITYSTQRDTLSVSEERGLLSNNHVPNNLAGEDLVVKITEGVENGSLDWDTSGAFRYIPRTGSSGRDVFTYTLQADGDTLHSGHFDVDVSSAGRSGRSEPDTLDERKPDPTKEDSTGFGVEYSVDQIDPDSMRQVTLRWNLQEELSTDSILIYRSTADSIVHDSSEVLNGRATVGDRAYIDTVSTGKMYRYDLAIPKDEERERNERSEVLSTVRVDLRPESASSVSSFSSSSWVFIGGSVSLIIAFLFVGIYSYRRRKSTDTASTPELDPPKAYGATFPDGSHLHIGNAQDIGQRNEQQDAFGFSDPSASSLLEENGLLAVVADGMGGMESGGTASRMTVDTLIDSHKNWKTEKPISGLLRKAVYRSNRAVLDAAAHNGLEGQTGTTVVATVVYDGILQWISVGDSRIYLWREGELVRLTRDHVYAHNLDKQVEDGSLSVEAAQNHPERGALTSYIGMPEIPHIDQSQRPLRLRDEDRILLCSDGLFNTLSHDQIANLLSHSPQDAGQSLIECIHEASLSHQDNATLIILRYKRGIDTTA